MRIEANGLLAMLVKPPSRIFTRDLITSNVCVFWQNRSQTSQVKEGHKKFKDNKKTKARHIFILCTVPVSLLFPLFVGFARSALVYFSVFDSFSAFVLQIPTGGNEEVEWLSPWQTGRNTYLNFSLHSLLLLFTLFHPDQDERCKVSTTMGK